MQSMIGEEQTTYARKFELLLQRYPHPERAGDPDPKRRQWKDTELAEATGGELGRTYLSALRKGRNNNPGGRALYLLSKAMGFPFELWMTEPSEWDLELRKGGGHNPSELLQTLFENFPADEGGSQPISAEEVARRSGGRISAQEVSDILEGREQNPGWRQLLAISEAFGVRWDYWAPSGEEELLGSQAAGALADDLQYKALMHRSRDLSSSQLNLVSTLVDQLRAMDDGGRRKASGH